MMMWTGFIWLGEGSKAGICEYRNESFLHQLSNCQVFKKN